MLPSLTKVVRDCLGWDSDLTFGISAKHNLSWDSFADSPSAEVRPGIKTFLNLFAAAALAMRRLSISTRLRLARLTPPALLAGRAAQNLRFSSFEIREQT